MNERKYKPWTLAEIREVNALIDLPNVRTVATNLGRTPDAVRDKLKLLKKARNENN